MDNTDSFWLFLSTCKSVQAIFDVGLKRSTLLVCYRHTLEENERKVHEHLIRYGVDASVWVLSHFQSLFCRSAFPQNYQAEIFSHIISSTPETRYATLVKIGVAILSCSRDLLLASRRRDEIVCILQNPPPLDNVDGERICALSNIYRMRDDDIVELSRLGRLS